MNRSAFLARLREGLTGLAQEDIDELISDYEAHFTEGAAAGRSDDDIQLNVPGTLHYRPGVRDTVEVRGPAYLLGHLEIDEEDIRYDCSPRRRAPRIEIYMAGEKIREFSIRGSGNMILENLDEERVEISIAGSGSVTATGAVERLSLSIAGSGDADLGALSVRDMEIAIAGSGDVIASPRDRLEVSIAGSGDVDLLTNPADIETSIMGSGRITGPSPTN